FTGRDIWYHGRAGFYNIERVNAKRNALYGLRIYHLGPDFRPQRVLEIDTATWGESGWQFLGGRTRHFGPNGVEESPGLPDGFTLPETLEDFRVASVEPEELSYAMLRRQIRDLRRKGVDISESWVDLHLKLSLPAASLVMMLIAVPLAARGTRLTSVAASAGIGIVLGFGYFMLLAFSRALGQSGALSPMVAAWLANPLFALVGGHYLLGADPYSRPHREPARLQTRGLPPAQQQVETLYRLPGRAVAEVVDRRHDPRLLGRRVPVPPDGATIRPPDLAQLRRGPLAPQDDERLLRVRLGEQLGERWPLAVHPYVDGRENAAAHGQQVRNEDDRRHAAGGVKLLFDLGAVSVAGERIRPDVLVHLGEELLHLRAAPRARRPRLGVDDHRLADEAGPRQRKETEQRPGGIATGRGGQARDRDPRPVDLGQAIDRLGEQVRRRVLTVPAGV